MEAPHGTRRSQTAGYLYDFGVDVALLLGPVQDGLLYGACAHEHQHQDIPLLPDAVCPILRLMGVMHDVRNNKK